MSARTETPEFKTPLRKLMHCFRRSRDSWKEKHHALKRKCKQLANQTAAVERSRECWRSKARQLRARVQELENELTQQKT